MDETNEITTKKCTKCGEVKALGGFNAKKASKDGKRAHCKECQKRHYEKNKARILLQQKTYYELNKPARAEAMRNYRIKHRDRLVEYIKVYRKDNPTVFRRADSKRRAMKRSLPHSPISNEQYQTLRDFSDYVFGGGEV